MLTRCFHNHYVSISLIFFGPLTKFFQHLISRISFRGNEQDITRNSYRNAISIPDENTTTLFTQRPSRARLQQTNEITQSLPAN